MPKKDTRHGNLNLEDIARLSGVSRSTVSRVVNGDPNVNAQTRQRVLEVIREHDFRPNPMAKALASQRLNVIGILIPHIVTEIFTDPFFPLLIQAVTSTANQQGYSVTLWLASSEVDQLTFYSQVFNHRLADGLIVASAVFDYPFLSKLDSLGKPYVLVGRPAARHEETHFVDTNSMDGGYLMARHLIECGRQRIGMIPGLQRLTSAQDRETGYCRALQEAGLPTFISPPGNYFERGGYEGMKYLLKEKVDAVFAASDVMAMGAIRAIQEAGLHIPDDIAVGGFDDIPSAAVSVPPLTTINQNITVLGASAAEALIAVLEEKQTIPYQKVLPVELVIRNSTCVPTV